MKTWSLVLLILLAVVQISVPVSLIQRKEKILREGALIRMKTRPVDPADPFQGRYVRLGYEHDYIPWPKEKEPDVSYGERIYAIIKNDADGYARFTGWSKEKPDDGSYISARYRGRNFRWNTDTKQSDYQGLRIDIPFDRFYMDEAKAPLAEKIARNATNTKDCWVEVRVLNGKGVIEDVFAEGQSLRVLAAEKE